MNKPQLQGDSDQAHTWTEIATNHIYFSSFWLILFYLPKLFWRYPKKIAEIKDPKKQRKEWHYFVSSIYALPHAIISVSWSLYIIYKQGSGCDFDMANIQDTIYLAYVN
jgi:hypothetical protein